MSKTIRLEDEVYNRLDNIRGKRETFSQSVDRLVKIHDGLGMITDIIEGNRKLEELKAERLKEEAATHG